MVCTLYQHAATAAGGIVYAMARPWVDQLNNQLHHRFGRIELATLFTSVVGKLLDQILVSIAQHVGLVQVIIAQLVLVKVTQQPLQGGISQHALVTVLCSSQYVLQLSIISLDGRECLIQGLTDIFGARDEIEPPGTYGEFSPFVLDLILSIAIA